MKKHHTGWQLQHYCITCNPNLYRVTGSQQISPGHSDCGNHYDTLELLPGRQLLFAHPEYTQTHTHPLSGPFSGTIWVGRYQKSKTNLDSTEARDSEWQWHQLGRMQVCTSLQTDNYASIPPLSFYRPDALPAAQPTASKHWRHILNINKNVVQYYRELQLDSKHGHSYCHLKAQILTQSN